MGVTRIKTNKYSSLAMTVTPVTRVTPHLIGYEPRSPVAPIPPAHFRCISRGLPGVPKAHVETRGRKPAGLC